MDWNFGERQKVNVLKAALLRAAVGISVSWLLVGCVASPSSQYKDLALREGLTHSELDASGFRLSVFSNDKPEGKFIHVYLEGDGTPFHRRVHINPDPTSTKATGLRLMLSDPNRAILIGRPCYHQKAPQDACRDNKWWTSHRYSAEVIQSLKSALEHLVPKDKSIALIGFSGGGSLAVLLASDRTLNIHELVTVSANLDIEAWASHNGYTPLFGSRNPVDVLPLEIKNTHIYGQTDTRLGFEKWLELLQTSAYSNAIVVPRFDHACCWSNDWPNLLLNIGLQ